LEPDLTVSEALFDREALCPMTDKVGAETPDLDRIRALRPDGGRSFFGPGVLELCRFADLVFIGLHGQCGEDGRLQAAFDLLGVPYTGSGYLGSAIAMDKDLAKRLAAADGIRTPAWKLVSYGAGDIARLVSETELPCVAKVPDGGSSIGVYICEDRDALGKAPEEVLPFGGEIILEQYVKGREFSVGVLEEKSLPPIEIIPKAQFYDYESKYQPGAALEVCPADIGAEVDRELRETALAIHRVLGLSVYSRSEFIVDEEGRAWFLEVNTLPGMTPTSLVPQEAAVDGISYEQLCRQIIEASLRLRGNK
jgi:D-alanine-D-alanine ligase